jgi:hypothetical protein
MTTSNDGILSKATDWEATMEWLTQEESDLQRQADAIDARLDVLREVKARLTGTADNRPRAPRKRRGAQQEQQAPSVPTLELESVGQ